MTNRLDEATLRARYEAGVRLHTRAKQQRQGETAALMLAVAAYDEAVARKPLARMAHAAQLFCIGAAFVIPNVLFVAYAL